LKELELRVGNAVGWTKTAIGKGASQEKMQEMMNLLLKPDGSSTVNSEALQISDGKIMEIHRKLMTFA
ncbi:MAG: hypothetical protein H7X84_03220, partial [Verrucomicrobia bacterium]|nr:hypothetical protein [Prolixibacteraceae bacterium]